MKTRLKPPEFSRLSVGIELSPVWGVRQRHEVPAFVIRHGTDGLGVEWCEFAPRPVVRLLQDTIRQLSGLADADEAAAIGNQPVPRTRSRF